MRRKAVDSSVNHIYLRYGPGSFSFQETIPLKKTNQAAPNITTLLSPRKYDFTLEYRIGGCRNILIPCHVVARRERRRIAAIAGVRLCYVDKQHRGSYSCLRDLGKHQMREMIDAACVSSSGGTKC